VVAIHALQDLAYLDVVPALRDVRRVLTPGGCLRLGLPDLERGVRAYVSGDRDYFYVPDDDAQSIGGKLCVQATWYGSVLTPSRPASRLARLPRRGPTDRMAT
jgi:hypothetical protein